MSESVSTAIDYYQNCNEDSRMANNPLEYIRCKEIISRYLNASHMNILDIGGATGAFSFWLAEQGHEVSLIDFTPKHIDIAKQREKEIGIKLSSLCVGDARELPYDNNFFDLVLLMGPLYHLTKKSDRLKSLSEAYRVLKPGGKMVCEVISRFASMVDGFSFGFVNDPEFVSIMQIDIETGLHVDTSSSKKYFTNSYFHNPQELSVEIEQAGFKFEDVIAVTSFGSTLPDITEKLKNEYYRKTLLDTIRLVEKNKRLWVSAVIIWVWAGNKTN
jgi:ubiquinone/menaquinone biosynthesis C-methylase UbiE